MSRPAVEERPTPEPIERSTAAGRARQIIATATGDPDWRDAAACRGMVTSIFFPRSELDDAWRDAEDVCAVCVVRGDCLAWALTTREEEGMRGGMRPASRRTARRQLYKARLRETGRVAS